MKHAILLSEWGMIDFLGSDVHHKKQAGFLKKFLQAEITGLSCKTIGF